MSSPKNKPAITEDDINDAERKMLALLAKAENGKLPTNSLNYFTGIRRVEGPMTMAFGLRRSTQQNPFWCPSTANHEVWRRNETSRIIEETKENGIQVSQITEHGRRRLEELGGLSEEEMTLLSSRDQTAARAKPKILAVRKRVFDDDDNEPPAPKGSDDPLPPARTPASPSYSIGGIYLALVSLLEGGAVISRGGLIKKIGSNRSVFAAEAYEKNTAPDVESAVAAALAQLEDERRVSVDDDSGQISLIRATHFHDRSGRTRGTER